MAGSTNRASTSADRHLHAWYELEPKTIGSGAYADVYRATHRLTGRHVAVKIFHANLGVEEGAEREIRIMRLLRHHPHVIRFYEAAVVVANVGDQACIVMELAESGELYKELYNQVISSQHGLDEAEVRRMFMQLVSGVAYCHRNMVVHHDLKLENVLLDAGKNVKLADFGFSDFFGPVQKPAADCGSLLYAAPEMCGDRTDTTRHLGPAVDMWSCGVILFAMLCGYLPFEGPDEPAIKRRIASGRVRIPYGISDEPRALISGMLQVCPERRMSIDEVRQHPWLQHSIPRYLAMLPPLHAAGQIFKENHVIPSLINYPLPPIPM
uniref:Protein kinase domain-containing protein n=1 Tax=Hordeum vulgare subsp. vulgare TaxID=112509 RepID=A0A8I6X3U9_HORVV